MKRKLLVAMMTLALVLGLGSTAFAEESTNIHSLVKNLSNKFKVSVEINVGDYSFNSEYSKADELDFDLNVDEEDATVDGNLLATTTEALVVNDQSANYFEQKGFSFYLSKLYKSITKSVDNWFQAGNIAAEKYVEAEGNQETDYTVYKGDSLSFIGKETETTGYAQYNNVDELDQIDVEFNDTEGVAYTDTGLTVVDAHTGEGYKSDETTTRKKLFNYTFSISDIFKGLDLDFDGWLK